MVDPYRIIDPPSCFHVLLSNGSSIVTDQMPTKGGNCITVIAQDGTVYTLPPTLVADVSSFRPHLTYGAVRDRIKDLLDRASLGHWLSQWQMFAKITREDIASKLGISSPTLYRYSQTDPRQEVCEQIMLSILVEFEQIVTESEKELLS